MARPLHGVQTMLRRHGAIQTILVQVGGGELPARLGRPQGPGGVVVLAEERDQSVAPALRARGLATLEIALVLSDVERFDIELLATRLCAITDWIAEHSNLSHLPIGYHAAGTGVAAALVAAARRPLVVRAIT